MMLKVNWKQILEISRFISILLGGSTDKEIIESYNEIGWYKKKTNKADAEGIFNAIVEVLTLLKLSERKSVEECLLNVYNKV